MQVPVPSLAPTLYLQFLPPAHSIRPLAPLLPAAVPPLPRQVGLPPAVLGGAPHAPGQEQEQTGPLGRAEGETLGENRTRRGLRPGQLDAAAGEFTKRQKELAGRTAYLRNFWYAAGELELPAAFQLHQLRPLSLCLGSVNLAGYLWPWDYCSFDIALAACLGIWAVAAGGLCCSTADGTIPSGAGRAYPTVALLTVFDTFSGLKKWMPACCYCLAACLQHCLRVSRMGSLWEWRCSARRWCSSGARTAGCAASATFARTGDRLACSGTLFGTLHEACSHEL